MLTITEAHRRALERNRPDIADLVLLSVDADLVDESVLSLSPETVAPALAEARAEAERRLNGRTVSRAINDSIEAIAAALEPLRRS